MQFLDDAADERPDTIPPTFRLSAKNLLLTYPHCGTELETAKTILLEALGRANVLYMCVAREHHRDGDLHIHAAVCLAERCNIRDPHALDILEHHGNYQGIRNVRQTIRYVKKDNVYIEYGELPSKYADEMDRQAILAALEKCESEASALTFIFTKGLSAQHNTLMSYWKITIQARTSGARYNVEDFLVCLPLRHLLEELPTSDQALLLIGPSGWGKTQYLLSYYSEAGTTVRATHLDDLKKVTPTTNVLILDDMEFGHLPRPTLLHLFDVRTDRSIHVRYSTARLHARLIIIAVANSIDLALGSFQDDPAVMRRVNIFQLPHKLWD